MPPKPLRYFLHLSLYVTDIAATIIKVSLYVHDLERLSKFNIMPENKMAAIVTWHITI